MQPLYSYLHGSNKQQRSLPSSAPLAVRITPNESFSGAANSTWTLTKTFTLAMYLANETMVRYECLSCSAALHHHIALNAVT